MRNDSESLLQNNYESHKKVKKTYLNPVAEWRVYKTVYNELGLSLRIEVRVCD